MVHRIALAVLLLSASAAAALDVPLTGPPSLTRRDVEDLVATDEGWTVAWRESDDGNHTLGLFLTRIDRDGDLLTAVPIRLTSNRYSYHPQLASDGTRVLAVWTEYHPVHPWSEPRRIMAALVEGDEVVEPPFVLVEYDEADVVFDGGRYLVLVGGSQYDGSHPGGTAVVTVETDARTVGEPILLSSWPVEGVAAAAGPSELLFVRGDLEWYDCPIPEGCYRSRLRLTRARWSDGAIELVDDPPIVVDAQQVDGIGVDGDSFVLSVREYNARWTVRLLPDGTLSPEYDLMPASSSHISENGADLVFSRSRNQYYVPLLDGDSRLPDGAAHTISATSGEERSARVSTAHDVTLVVFSRSEHDQSLNDLGDVIYVRAIPSHTDLEPPPPPVSDVAVEALSSSVLAVSWNAEPDLYTACRVDIYSGEPYNVFSEYGGFDLIVYGGSGGDPYAKDRTVSGLLPDRRHRLVVACEGPSGLSPYRSGEAATYASNRPRHVEELRATQVSSRRVRLEWKDVSSNETGFLVMTPYAEVATVGAGSEWAEIPVKGPGSYNFWVVSMNGSIRGESAYVNIRVDEARRRPIRNGGQ